MERTTTLPRSRANSAEQNCKKKNRFVPKETKVGFPWFVDAYLLYGLLPLDGGGVRRSVESWELRSLGFRDAPNERVKVVVCFPIPSMYGIFTYIWLIFIVNAGKYTIHGCYGFFCLRLVPRFEGGFGCFQK